LGYNQPHANLFTEEVEIVLLFVVEHMLHVRMFMKNLMKLLLASSLSFSLLEGAAGGPAAVESVRPREATDKLAVFNTSLKGLSIVELTEYYTSIGVLFQPSVRNQVVQAIEQQMIELLKKVCRPMLKTLPMKIRMTKFELENTEESRAAAERLGSAFVALVEFDTEIQNMHQICGEMTSVAKSWNCKHGKDISKDLEEEEFSRLIDSGTESVEFVGRFYDYERFGSRIFETDFHCTGSLEYVRNLIVRGASYKFEGLYAKEYINAELEEFKKQGGNLYELAHQITTAIATHPGASVPAPAVKLDRIKERYPELVALLS
jgi:hypothetical protein